MFDTLTAEAAQLAELGAARRAESAATARTLQLAAEVVRDRRSGADPGLAEFAVLEVAAAVCVPRGTAWAMVTLGEDLRDRLPAIGRALATGDIDYARARTLAERLAGIDDPELRAAVEAEVLDRVVGQASTASATAAAADRVVARLAPAFARERVRQAVADRELRVAPAADGMAAVSGLLTAADGRAVDHRLDVMTTQPCADDPRTRAQRRADALVALAVGATRLACSCGQPDCVAGAGPVPNEPVPNQPVPTRPAPGTAGAAPQGSGTAAPDDDSVAQKVVVHVVVSAEVLAGAADLPGVLRRLGVVDADTVRSLAADATWKQLLTLDGTPVHLGRARPAGQVGGSALPDAVIPPTAPDDAAPPAAAREAPAPVQPPPAEPTLGVDPVDPDHDPSVLRYTPSDRLAELVRDRDGHCRFPGCHIAADRCDIDHVLPFDHEDPRRGGWTVRWNLGCLCRYHHRSKTAGVWAVAMEPGGTQHWTGPTGQRFTTTPEGLPPVPDGTALPRAGAAPTEPAKAGPATPFDLETVLSDLVELWCDEVRTWSPPAALPTSDPTPPGPPSRPVDDEPPPF